VAAALAALPGIGPWTAQYVALRALAEPDAMPTGDLVLRRMAAPGERRLSARELEARARHWQPWRGYAVVHLWCAAAERAVRAGVRSRRAPTPARATSNVMKRNGCSDVLA
jgi:AraC family transcriptional regulator of adaptative response / DNA-3-methyladenine glycosylase II